MLQFPLWISFSREKLKGFTFYTFYLAYIKKDLGRVTFKQNVSNYSLTKLEELEISLLNVYVPFIEQGEK